MNVQVIEKRGKPEWAVIPYDDYQRLLADAEMLQDIGTYDDAKRAVADGEELVPSEVTYAILDGGDPIHVLAHPQAHPAAVSRSGRDQCALSFAD